MLGSAKTLVIITVAVVAVALVAAGTALGVLHWLDSNESSEDSSESISESITWRLTTVVDGQGRISPSGGTFPDNSMITLTAIPSSGWEFSHWGAHCSGSQNPITIAMNNDKTVYAYFNEVGQPHSATSTPQSPYETLTPEATSTPGSETTPTPEPTSTSISETTPTPAQTATQTSLDRSPWGNPEAIMPMYITPDDPDVQDAVDDILNGYWRWAYNDFEAMKQWVATHVSYRRDIDVHGQEEYWQLPSETLDLGTGDCEDFAILLVSLLRAYGVPDDEVYVGCGLTEGIGHAFLFDHWYEGYWRAVEPQEGATWDWVGITLLDISHYEDFYSFNDQKYFPNKPSSPLGVYEFEVGYSSWPVTSGATEEFTRHLNSGQSVTGSIEWHGTSVHIYDWDITVYKPDSSEAYSWSGTDLSHDFSFVASQSGTYTIEILKRDYMPRVARMDISPEIWTQQ